VIKQRLLRALHGAGVTLHDIQPASAIYPKDGPLSGYFYHSDPVVLAYWPPARSAHRSSGRLRGITAHFSACHRAS